jgi:hypothetical protein
MATFSGICQLVVTRGSGKTRLVSEGLVSEGLGKASSDHGHHPTASPPHAISDSSDIFSSTPTNKRKSDKRPESDGHQRQPSKPHHPTILPPTPPLLLPNRRPIPPTAWENYHPGLDFFVPLHGSSNQNHRRSRRAALGAIRTWIPYLWTSVHGRRSTTSRIGFQTL